MTEIFVGLMLLLAPLMATVPDKPAQVIPHAEVRSPHGPLNMACENCHTYTSWKPIRAIPEFDHAKTKFPLLGLHKSVTCTQCHTKLVFSKVGNKCSDCHADIHRGQFGATCERCHSEKGWHVSTKDIANHFNGFPLTGAHAMVQCDSCHKNAAAGQFQGLSTQCYSCHRADFATPVIDHRALGFPTTCQDCHNMNSFAWAKFDHLKYTGFALTGMHITLSCQSCHPGGRYKGTPANCLGCHQADYNGAKNPNHVQAGFPTDCGLCHSTTAWSPAKFDHSTTGFPLTGAHVAVQCAACHKNGQYAGLSTTCYSCHSTDFNGTKTPPHVAAGLPTDCTVCHTTTAWSPAKFDHTTYGHYTLTGAHTSLQCVQCHASGYTNTSTACSSCHMTDYNNTTNPNHKTAGFPTDCATCHTTAAWSPASFNHATTGFALTGAHATLQCSSCHKNGVYTGLSPLCYSCHQADYAGTTNPNHVQAGFPTDCTMCHGTAAWSPSTFNHSNTGFPLVGAHTSLQCSTCHKNAVYTGLSPLCYSCHTADFTGTAAPPHVAAALPTDCTICHAQTAWSPAKFDHTTYGKYTLTGAHTTLLCTQCHASGYLNTSTLCSGCHMADYNGTTNPNHKTAGFPTDCSVCHSTTAWSPATFDHSTTGFALTGAHTTLACASCHLNGVYTGLSPVCYSCHTTDYNGTTNPAHKTLGFPTDCTMCHTTTAWSPSSFNHSTTTFPLTGAHTTVACASCHVNGNYTTVPTDCYSCHTADYTGTTNPNHVSAAFPKTCATCHTTTSWLGATFSHTWFPIYSGTHNGKWTSCTDCHVNSADYSVFSCINCHQHTQANTDPHHTGVRNYVYSATSCYSCHPTGNGG